MPFTPGFGKPHRVSPPASLLSSPASSGLDSPTCVTTRQAHALRPGGRHKATALTWCEPSQGASAFVPQPASREWEPCLSASAGGTFRWARSLPCSPSTAGSLYPPLRLGRRRPAPGGWLRGSVRPRPVFHRLDAGTSPGRTETTMENCLRCDAASLITQLPILYYWPRARWRLARCSRLSGCGSSRGAWSGGGEPRISRGLGPDAAPVHRGRGGGASAAGPVGNGTGSKCTVT